MAIRTTLTGFIYRKMLLHLFPMHGYMYLLYVALVLNFLRTKTNMEKDIVSLTCVAISSVYIDIIHLVVETMKINIAGINCHSVGKWGESHIIFHEHSTPRLFISSNSQPLNSIFSLTTCKRNQMYIS